MAGTSEQHVRGSKTAETKVTVICQVSVKMRGHDHGHGHGHGPRIERIKRIEHALTDAQSHSPFPFDTPYFIVLVIAFAFE
jgi:hypothetical protein